MNPGTEQDYQRIIQQQQARIAELEKKVQKLSAQVARLSKNSSNSSKPPSSDIVKPPKPPTKDGDKRRLGGQPGHARHERTPFAPDQINQTLDYRPVPCSPACPPGRCGGFPVPAFTSLPVPCSRFPVPAFTSLPVPCSPFPVPAVAVSPLFAETLTSRRTRFFAVLDPPEGQKRPWR
jgi:hypothetical protein